MNERISQDMPMARARPQIIEPLGALARFAFDWAPVFCSPSHGCMPYHRFWSMMRLIDLDGLPPKGAEFFGQAFAQLRTGGRTPRILLAGAADTGLTALVLNAALANDLEPEIVIIDRCETPLRQNELFARGQDDFASGRRWRQA